MKVEGLLFACGTFVFGLVAVIYWILSEEVVGTTALAFTAGLAFLVGYYILFTGRRVDTRPEDRLDAEIVEGAGELGFFSPHSWWPLPLAFFAAVIFAGVAIGWWMVLLGVIGAAFSVIGLIFEYYRGDVAH